MFKLYFSNGVLNFSRSSSGTIRNGETIWNHEDSINARFIIQLIVRYSKKYYLNNMEEFAKNYFIIFSNEGDIE